MSVEQLLNDDKVDLKRPQLQVARATGDLQTLFEEIFEQKSADSPDIINVIKNVCVYLSLVFKVALEVTKPLVQVPNIEKKPLLSAKTNSAAALLEPKKPANGGKNKRRLQLFLSSSTTAAAEKEEPKENDQSIPIDATEFTYEGKSVPLHVDQLHGVQLSHGNFGSVSSVLVKSAPDFRIAVKHSRLSMVSEVKILQLVETPLCPYIVDYYCSMRRFGTDDLFICMELMDTSITTFYQTMHALKELASNQFDQVVRRTCHDVVSALRHLESKQVLHRDVKPDNLLINRSARVKLADFGLSRTFSEMKVETEGILAAANYMPPTLSHSIQDDMWALGISLFEMVNGRNPFGDQPSFENLLKIRQWEPEPVVLGSLAEDLQELLLHLLKKEANERPRSYTEILSKPAMCQFPSTPTKDECDFACEVIRQMCGEGKANLKRKHELTLSPCFCARAQCTCLVT